MADDILKNIPLPADLPENWTSGQIIAPTGAEVGLDEQHGYNYLMKQVNNAQKALKVLAARREEDYTKIKFWVSPDPTSPAELFGGTWEQIAQDRALMGASGSHAADTTVEAGLPNITGLLRMRGFNNDVDSVVNSSGAMVREEVSAWSGNHAYASTLFGDQAGSQNINFNASKSNSIYGKSSTVQPAAYYVYMWRRVA